MLYIAPSKISPKFMQIPVDNHLTMVKSIVEQPAHKVLNDNSLLGWCTMVAPTSKTANPPHTGDFGPTVSGDVHQLPRAIYECAKMAPNLHTFIRGALQAKQISLEDTNTFLSSHKSLGRYDNAFRLLLGICKHRGINPTTASLPQLASQILYLNKFLPSQAKNAYSACLLLPGLDQLRFSPILGQAKRAWNKSSIRYPCFWDVHPILERMKNQTINWNSVAQVRARLILTTRIFMLFRSGDLANTFRCMSKSGDTHYIMVRRKGHLKPHWEPIINIGLPHLNPFHLLKKYVAMTASCVPAGSLLLRSLIKPFRPLSANAIGSATRAVLKELGVDNSIWGPHSTRGAGGQFYKNLGMTSEHVFEIGQWKNVEAFTQHYLRLGASREAEAKLNPYLVHNVSPRQSAEPEWSRTPGRKPDQGGRDHEGEARSQGETRSLLPAQMFI